MHAQHLVSILALVFTLPLLAMKAAKAGFFLRHIAAGEGAVLRRTTA